MKARLARLTVRLAAYEVRKPTLWAIRDAKQIEFEAKHGVKSGDKVTTKGGTTYFYERFIIDAYGWITILCHPAKKDGTASKVDRHLSDVDF